MSSSAPRFNENEIRPDDLRAGQVKAFAADVAWLQEHLDEFVTAGCPACGSHNSQPVFTKFQLTYHRCDACGTVFVNPRPPLPLLNAYYARSENYAYWNKYIFPASEEARRERIFRPRARRTLEICSRYHVPTGTLLEVGAGFGTFCEEIRAGGAFERIIAVEPTPDLVETCRARGLEVIATPIEEVSLPAGSVDVIASFEVLEHLFSPQRFVEDCSKLLAPGGLLIVTCPNIRGFDLVTLGPLSETIDVEHLNYFHPASLRLLFERCGLEVLEVQTPGQLDAELVRKKALAGEIDLSSQPFLQQILLDEWERAGATFQSFLADNLLSSHMWVIGRKPYS